MVNPAGAQFDEVSGVYKESPPLESPPPDWSREEIPDPELEVIEEAEPETSTAMSVSAEAMARAESPIFFARASFLDGCGAWGVKPSGFIA